MDSNDVEQAQVFMNEVISMASMDHPNIIKIVDYNEATNVITKNGQRATVSYIATEYAEEGELFNWITKTGKFTEIEARFFFSQLIEGLESLHNMGLYHRDIKPENLLLDKDYTLKIADFGFATQEPICSIRKGTVKYMAPEMLENRAYYSAHADLYACAITLFNLVTGLSPADTDEIDDQFWTTHVGEELSSEFKDLFKKMVSYNPEDRLTINEIKSHSWYTGSRISKEKISEILNIRKEKTSARKSYSKTNRVLEVSKCPIRSKSDVTKRVKKHTQFYKVERGDDMIDEIIKFCKVKGYKFRKSSKFYQVQIISQRPSEETQLVVNILKKNSRGAR